jgi:L1 cell adhesion molecule like protein
MLLIKLKETIEASLDRTIKNVVIIVPVHFNNSWQHATIDTGTIAGLFIMGIIVEHTVATIA